MKPDKLKTLLYLLPYLVLILIGGWYRMHTSDVAFYEGDTDTYTNPAFLKAITGKWYLDERPLQYLQFIYFLLIPGHGLYFVVIAQKILDIAGAGFLTAAWIRYVGRSNRNNFLSHLAGYVMLGIYISSPVLMYYEQLIAPESVCMFLMCVLIYCLTAGLTGYDKPKTMMGFLSAAIFVNLYLSHPMTKFIFVSLVLELILVAKLMRSAPGWRQGKLLLILLPHALYVLLVLGPEIRYKTERPFQNRVYIEYEQMVYTHFDLLMKDRSDFDLPGPAEDSLLLYFHGSQIDQANTLTGFSNDYLMFGRASGIIDEYYHYNYDSIGHLYRHLCYILATKYPIALAREICAEVTAFYIPNKIIHKDLFSYYFDYSGLKDQIRQSDEHLAESLHYINGQGVDPGFLLLPHYQSQESVKGIIQFEQLPLLFGQNFFFYRWFDEIFIVAMLLFFLLKAMKRELLKVDTVSILYLIIFIYVLTVSIVHTFDVNRFIATIYPFILITTFMAIIYIGQSIYSIVSGPDRNK